MKLINKLSVVSLAAFAALFCIHPNISESEEMISTANKQVKLVSYTSNNKDIQDKVIIKAVEPILIHSSNGHKTVEARIDTGATQSSIDLNQAKELGYTRYIGKVNVVSANGIKSRLLVEVSYELSGRKIKSTFTLADRSNLNYSVLIGRTDLDGFLIDPTE